MAGPLDPYQQSVGAGNTAPLPMASPDVFGASIGRSIQGLGDSVEHLAVVERGLKRNEEAANASVNLQTAIETTRQYEQDDQAGKTPDYQPRGAGHQARVLKQFDAASTQLLDGITDPRVRREMEARVIANRTVIADRADTYEAAQRLQGFALDSSMFRASIASRVGRSDDQQDIQTAIGDLSAGIEAMDAPPSAKEKVLQGAVVDAHDAFLLGQADRHPELVDSLIKSGHFDALGADRLNIIKNSADAELRRQASAARAQEAHERSVQRDQLGAIEVTLGSGAGTVQDRAKLAQQYAAIGDESKAAEWRGKAQEFGAVQGSRDWTLPQFDNRLAELEHKRAAGGLSGSEANEFNGLKDARTAAAGRLDQPGGALLQMQYAGVKLAPLDPGDPASLQDRARQAAIAAQKYGRVSIEPILPTELQPFKDLMQGGPASKLQALAAIQGFGDPKVIAGAARQMAGQGDGDFRIAATLPIEIARDVLRGADRLKTNPGVWNEKLVPNVLRRYYGSVLGFLPADYAADVRQAATQYYATRMSEGDGTKPDEGHFAEAIETVLGRQVTPRGVVMGGIAHTPAGIVLVPPGMTSEGMLQRFARALPGDYRKAADDHVPVWPDGTAVKVPDFRALLPTALDGTHYGFRGRDGRLMYNDKGGVYTVDITKLPAK